jgi:hypothetical protein
MEAIRKIITVKQNILKIELPDDYINETVELIILKSNPESISKVEEPAFDYSKLYGSLKLGKSADEINEKLKALRKEWERDIS